VKFVATLIALAAVALAVAGVALTAGSSIFQLHDNQMAEYKGVVCVASPKAHGMYCSTATGENYSVFLSRRSVIVLDPHQRPVFAKNNPAR